jgi:hypothetical protein
MKGRRKASSNFVQFAEPPWDAAPRNGRMGRVRFGPDSSDASDSSFHMDDIDYIEKAGEKFLDVERLGIAGFDLPAGLWN